MNMIAILLMTIIYQTLNPITTIYDYKSFGLVLVSVSLNVTSFVLFYKINDKLADIIKDTKEVFVEHTTVNIKLEDLNKVLVTMELLLKELKDLSQENKYVGRSLMENTRDIKDNEQSSQVQLSTIANSLASLIENLKEIIAKLIDALSEK